MRAVDSAACHIASISSTCGLGVSQVELPSVRTLQGVGSHEHHSQVVRYCVRPSPSVLGGGKEPLQSSFAHMLSLCKPGARPRIQVQRGNTSC